jgi:hypothetical protein
VSLHESTEPLAQLARLSGSGIEFARRCGLAQFGDRLRRHQAGPQEPGDQVFARPYPLDLSIHGRCERIQKIQTREIRDEDRRGSFVGHENHLDPVSRCNHQNDPDKLPDG